MLFFSVVLSVLDVSLGVGPELGMDIGIGAPPRREIGYDHILIFPGEIIFDLLHHLRGYPEIRDLFCMVDVRKEGVRNLIGLFCIRDEERDVVPVVEECIDIDLFILGLLREEEQFSRLFNDRKTEVSEALDELVDVLEC